MSGFLAVGTSPLLRARLCDFRGGIFSMQRIFVFDVVFGVVKVGSWEVGGIGLRIDLAVLSLAGLAPCLWQALTSPSSTYEDLSGPC